MQNRKRDTNVQNTLLDFVGEGEGGMFRENSIETCILSTSPAQVGCMRQVPWPGSLGRPRGIRQRERGEGGSGWGTHVNPWLIHVNVWQKPLQLKKKQLSALSTFLFAHLKNKIKSLCVVNLRENVFLRSTCVTFLFFVNLCLLFL